MSEWKTTTLSQICSNISYGYTASAGNDISGSKFLRITDIVPDRIDWERVPYCAANEADREKYRLKNGDIVIARTGATTGYNKIIKNISFDAVFASYLVRYEIDKTKAVPEYIGHVLQSSIWYDYINAIAGGSAQPGANAKQLGSFEFPLPPLPAQRAIANILSSLDDKIDLLHRQNKTLESLAETLFRQWFIEEARADWREGSLLELIELVGGGTPKTSASEYWDGDIPWLAGGDITNNHKGFVLSSQKNITQEGLDNSAAKLLPKYATVISARGTVGKHCLLAKKMAFSQSNYGVLPKNEGCYFFTHLLINHLVEELQSAAYGSVFDTITTATFRDAKIPVPPQKLIHGFENEIRNYFDKQLLNKHQIQTLGKLRDTLLPMFINGEIRVAA